MTPGPAEVPISRGSQAEQGARLANLDGPFRNNLKLVFVASYQSAVRSRRTVNSIAPSGSSRQRWTSLI
jgi:hypothetical protein